MQDQKVKFQIKQTNKQIQPLPPHTPQQHKNKSTKPETKTQKT